MIKFLLFFFLLLPMSAFGFPENTRHGYSSCQSCHVSPSGGGVLSAYGKMTADEFLSTWSYEGAGTSSFGAIPHQDVLNVGGDVRTLHVGSGDKYRRFLMQADLELALHLSKQITFVGSAGYYNLPLPTDIYADETPESRRHYLLLKPQKWLTLRAGKFTHAFGLMIPDHSANVRKGLGFGQGSESYNGEVGFFGSFGELLITHSGETPDQVIKTSARSAVYLGKRSQMVLSGTIAPGTTSESLGILFSFTEHAYGMAELARRVVEGAEPTHMLWTRFGIESARGFHTFAGYEGSMSEEYKALGYYGVQWFPVPHIELLAQEKRGETCDYLISAHYYF